MNAPPNSDLFSDDRRAERTWAREVWHPDCWSPKLGLPIQSGSYVGGTDGAGCPILAGPPTEPLGFTLLLGALGPPSLLQLSCATVSSPGCGDDLEAKQISQLPL